MLEKPDLRMGGGQALEDGVGSVGGAIVDDNQFTIHALRKRRGEHERDAALDHGALIKHRHENGQFQAVYQYNKTAMSENTTPRDFFKGPGTAPAPPRGFSIVTPSAPG